jgi:hypothetical protein
MTYYMQLGNVPHKRHTQFRKPDGSLHHEEVMGIHGFAGIQSILYHLHPPTRVREIERYRRRRELEYEDGDRCAIATCSPTGTSRPAATRSRGACRSWATATWRSTWRARPDPMDYWYRFAHGDDVIFVHDGTGTLETQFGTLRYRPGDYLVLPTGVIWRISPTRAWITQLHIEAFGHVEPPKRYINRYGQFLENSPYCERDLRGPPSSSRTTRRASSRCTSRRAGRSPGTSTPPPARRGRLGRPPLAVRVQHRRLRADHRPRAPAAAGAPDVRRPGLRGVLVRAANVRLPPRGDPGARTTTRTSTPTRSSTTSRATSCRARGSSGRRSPCTRTASRTGRTPARTRARSGRRATEELAVMVDTFRPLRLTKQDALRRPS